MENNSAIPSRQPNQNQAPEPLPQPVQVARVPVYIGAVSPRIEQLKARIVPSFQDILNNLHMINNLRKNGAEFNLMYQLIEEMKFHLDSFGLIKTGGKRKNRKTRRSRRS